MKKIVLLVAMFILGIASFAKDKLNIGVTLQPYYSYVTNIVGDTANVVPVVRLDIYDSHNYQVRAEDITKMDNIDVLVVNGIGHDEFVFKMLDAAKNKDRIKVIYANKNVSLMPIAGTQNSEKILNPHTFISITASIQQVYNIAKELGEINPEYKALYMKNAREYARKLRKIKSDALEKIKGLEGMDLRVATAHGGYDYLFSEFGIEVKAVIEPAHGVQPSAAELEKVINKIKKEKVDVIFGEKAFNSKYVDTINKETGVEVRYLSHLTNGPYEVDGFEKFIKQDLDEVVSAIQEVAKKRGK
ncbi:Manganese ABC transporter substrate-binding lipoprotein [Fusobacterium sp. DD29]|uniref:metal ABC transporter solute-binding protein, Zn/Mn family n=1 Tax=unclassified Fusobacterium TaxID=2648384 RepID=UPI001B8B207B|nr:MULTISPECIES: zinc ABC transporter substrate-binding protein [unclassified Fusobacterium]MBR8700331.1 Manganese ABC transporter substrate-binding lipoprotein [Fusobacterium sp. DD45]MBR8710024.1 Manganese ABC transporter substrate-binding lipoprotein [Fusobacterium sp. DD28]MBR8748460.1 Manganese ABC transporter substrate-binding lipoprotein [Fusobacterium sp. DD29]MBR8750576.1 Manganese ABC transporter substrate-binding lipoprotein [Fusobacterium sp. DD26]MBR8760727.1 Manganese ABC transpo